MSIRLLTTDDDLAKYESWVRSHPHGSLWQSIVRKRYAEACGKKVRIYVKSDERSAVSGQPLASALVIIDRTTGGYSTWEIPRGPLWLGDRAAESLLQHIIDDATKDHCMALYLSPPLELVAGRWSLVASKRPVHATATRIIDLTKSEGEILAQMHPKGRYNINVAKRHGVEIVQGSLSDLDAFYPMLQETARRDGFTVSQKSHYTRFLSNLVGSFILMAKHDKKPIAGLIGVMWQGTGIYYYGASFHEQRHLMAPYLLQWEAMRKCQAAGCTRYDLLGIEPENEGSGILLRQGFGGQVRDQGSGKWKGISEFKRKFGGAVVTYPPEQMVVLRPIVKKVLEWKRALLG